MSPEKVFRIILPKIGEKFIIKSISRATCYYDYPKLIQYGAEIKNDSKYLSTRAKLHAAGTSFNEYRALIKTIGEGIERYSLSVYDKKDLIYSSYSRLVRNGCIAVNPMELSVFSDKQLKNDSFLSRKAKINENSKFYWINALDLIDDEVIFIPAQKVFVPYFFENEPFLSSIINTGTAAGTSYVGSILRGIYEAIEIDAFLIFYLNKLTPPLVDISKSKTLRKIVEYYNSYYFNVYIFDITTELNIPTYLTILVDQTKKGPPLSIGVKTNLNPYIAIRDSLEEVFHTLPWVRTLILKGIKTNTGIRYFEDRALFWSSYRKLKLLDFFFKSSEYVKMRKNLSARSQKKDLKKIIKNLKKGSFRIYVVDLTPSNVEEVRFKVTKVIVPELYPLYIDERFKGLGGRRLYEVPVKMGLIDVPKKEEELNKIPHPML